ncbi:hypothetical protein SAY87_018436 [Trapa incisa]|uniref:Protein kinase domain-containing protein n=1 Tax=Trapa incisa TaxID=236973 RepID=A0AAN7QST1_9MYRT|nr:hypothetical protein SAY87_018436 [Trapa incisa]
MRKALEAFDKERQCDRVKSDAFTGDKLFTDEDLYDVCLQTGEEFSSEFLRDRISLRRVNIMMPNVDVQQPMSASFVSTRNFNNSFYEDVASFPHHRRVYSNCTPHVLEHSNLVKLDKKSSDVGVRALNLDEMSWFHGGLYDYFNQGGLGLSFDNNGNTRIVTTPSSESPQSHKKMKFLCSYGGKIFLRHNDGKLRYIGGETRIISFRENITWHELVMKTLAICPQQHTIKYQLPGEDLDALISVSTDEDLHHMIEEYQELEKVGGSQKLRLFLMLTNEMDNPTPGSHETKEMEQSGVDFQYVPTANGIMDRDFNKQGVTNQLNQVGTYNSSCTEDSGQAQETKKLSPSYAKLMEISFSSSTPLFCNNTQVITNVLGKSPSNNILVSNPILDDQSCSVVVEGTIPTLMERIPKEKSTNIIVQDSSMFHVDELKSLVAEAEQFDGESVSQGHVKKSHKDISHALHVIKSDERLDNIYFDYDAKIDLPFKGPNESSTNITIDENFGKVEYPPLEVGDFSSREWHMKSQDLHEVDESLGQNMTLTTSLCGNHFVDFGNKINSTKTINREANGIDDIFIVEDVTNNLTSSDILIRSKIVVPRIENEFSDVESLSRELEVGSNNHDIDSKEAGSLGEDGDNPISDAAIAEIEADMYGLQIIKNVDLEELQELGSGTFGTVYHGKWRGTDVAIKRIRKSCFAGKSSEQERLTKDFWREAKILSNLHHPNVVAFYGLVPDCPGGTISTVTEFMVNSSLRHNLLRNSRLLDGRKKLIIATDAAVGMEYLHKKNIVHFDLKCDNLLVNLKDPRRPICKVGDFGLSRIKQNTLVSGGVRGTLPWMAPELLNGSNSRVSEKVDVFSFGIVMWEMLTGEEPYANMHCGAIIGGIVNNTLRPPIPERCDVGWRKLMEDCWAHDPSHRPSFTEITDRLRFMSNTTATPGWSLSDRRIK